VPPIDPRVLDTHKQLFDLSCIPAGVELVLKFLGKLDPSEHPEQGAWGNKRDGSFNDYHGKVLRGVHFAMEFTHPRSPDFPLSDLFTRISEELRAGRFVVISLRSGGGWHIFVVVEERPDGEFIAVSKAGDQTIGTEHVREIVTKMKGTDILTYTTT